MNDFIKTQQELARDTLIQSDASGFATLSDSEVDEIITQIIKNTGEKLMRLAEGEQRDIEVRLLSEGVSRDRIQQMDKYQAIDTLKQHIASVTGVE